MASIWDFIGGAADTHLETIKTREEVERDKQKAEYLENLQRKTSDYKFNRDNAYNEKKPDPNQSYADYDKGVYVLVSSLGQKIGERPLTSTEIAENKEARELKGLDIQHKRAQIADIAENNALAREQLALSRRGLGRGGGIDSDPKTGRLYGLAQNVEKSISSLGAPTGYVAKIRSELYNGINQGWTEKDLREYEAAAIRTLVKHGTPDKWDTINRYLERDRAAAAAAFKAKSD